MSANLQQQVIALAGLLQALSQVRRIADTGHADPAALQTAMHSIFQLDAPSVVAVYGNISALRTGFRLLAEHLGAPASGPKDQLLPKLTMAVLQLERNFSRNASMLDRVHQAIAELQPQALAQGVSDDAILAALGKLYTQTLSHLNPRVMVQGDPQVLAQAHVVAQIRAVLLAAVRSAMLWRQLDGSFWDFLLRRGQIREQAEQLARA